MGFVDSKALVHRCGFERDRELAGLSVLLGTVGGRNGRVRGKGSLAAGGAIPAARQRGSGGREEPPDPAAQGRALPGLRLLP
jgi:hypothetical protein